jgi:hypothetical protein
VISTVYWLIWSNEHEAWWRPNEYGYTRDIQQAGKYPIEDARRICTKANTYGKIEELMGPVPNWVDILNNHGEQTAIA